MNNRFVFIVPMFNATATLPRMLHSICAQSYEDWRVILIDDMSDHAEVLAENKIVFGFQELLGRCGSNSTKVEAVWNMDGRGKRWEVDNVLHGISMCKDDDIVCRIDADDWLIDSDALTIIDSAYQESDCDVLWTSHRWGFSDKNISGPLPNGADPYRHPWVTSHLKTFRKKLLNDVNDNNYRGQDGKYIRRAGDQAIYLPALYRSKKHMYLPRSMYHYNIKDVPATYQTDDARFQRDEALFLRSRGFVE